MATTQDNVISAIVSSQTRLTSVSMIFLRTLQQMTPTERHLVGRQVWILKQALEDRGFNASYATAFEILVSCLIAKGLDERERNALWDMTAEENVGEFWDMLH